MPRLLMLAVAMLVLAVPALAAPGPQSYTTTPPGTGWGNPQPWADNPLPLSQAYAVVGHLALLKGAALTGTGDQPITMLTLPPKFQVTSIYVTNCSTTPAGAAGGIYTAAAKAGTAIVAAAQTYTALTTVTAIQSLTVAIATSVAPGQLYFSLTTGASAGTPTCDLYMDGIGLQ